jgi:hypothetical protein
LKPKYLIGKSITNEYFTRVGTMTPKQSRGALRVNYHRSKLTQFADEDFFWGQPARGTSNQFHGDERYLFFSFR